MAEWDGITYCAYHEWRPATTKVIIGMRLHTPIYELVCTTCALQTERWRGAEITVDDD